MRSLLLLASAALTLAYASTARAQFCPGVSPWVFDDIAASDPFCGYITWMAENGITLGCQTIDANHRLYCPNAAVTRAAMAAFMNRLGNVRVEAVGTGPGLVGGPITSTGTISLAATQLLPTTACANNQVPRWNGSAWTCATLAAGGSVTSVASGAGLTGGPITTIGTLSIASGYQLPQGCASGDVAKSNGSGSWACASDAAGTGTVTSVAAGSGLTGGTITTSGTIAVNTSAIQVRVTGTCTVGSYVRAIAADGTVTCGTDNAGPANAYVQNGNAFAATGVIGTADNFALDVRVNGARVMRFEPNGITSNVIGGNPANFATAGVRGATIAGGGIPAGDTDPNYPLEGPNRVTDNFGTVGGGYANQAGDNAGAFGDRPFATVGGGIANTASGDTSFVGGGALNIASGAYGTVSGGIDNQASGRASTVGGGDTNVATRDFSAVGGGGSNTASGYGSLVAGGGINTASADYATIGGGYQNAVAGYMSSVWSGRGHSVGAGADYAFIGGGYFNAIGADAGYSVVAGGAFNFADGDSSTVSGGWLNKAHNFKSTVAGGYNNTAGYDFSFVGGGRDNVANGHSSVVAGGYNNAATGATSQAGGYYANANYDGCYVWGDLSTSNTISCNSPNRYVVRSLGGVFFFAGGSTQATYTGVALPPGGTAWVVASDRNIKENVIPVDRGAVLASVVSLPIATWNLKAQDPSIRHMGAMAQDFRAAFGLGESDVGINTIDADGVALAAIQGLNEKLEAKIREQAREIAALHARHSSEIDDLRRAVEVLLARTAPDVSVAAR